jgi:hypothetical protein
LGARHEFAQLAPNSQLDRTAYRRPALFKTKRAALNSHDARPGWLMSASLARQL